MMQKMPPRTLLESLVVAQSWLRGRVPTATVLPWRIRSSVLPLPIVPQTSSMSGCYRTRLWARLCVVVLQQSATWDATVRVISYDGATIGTPANETFTLLVSYGGTSENTLAVMGAKPSIGLLGAFTIDGKFTRNGVIYGTVDFAGNAGTGTLTGLIGDAGVVGIFKSDAETGATTSALAYVGGFTATSACQVFAQI